MNDTNRKRAVTYLEELGCEVWLNTGVAKYDGTTVETRTGKQLHTNALIWAAGIKPVLINGLKPECINPRGRIIIDDYCRVSGYENIFAIGDVAIMVQADYPNGHPQIAPVAIQQAQLLASNIKKTLKQWTLDKFSYFDKGTMATVGRNRAVVEVGKLTFGRFMGWLAWMGLHLMLLVGFRNKIVVFINWLWNYINYDRNIRLIIRPFKREEV
jgi:NADH dehydrogenase